MKEKTLSKEFEYIGEYYRVSKHLGTNLIKIEVLVPNGFWGKSDMIYKTIYFGFPQPITEALNFFNKHE